MNVSGFCGGAIADALLCEYIAIAISSTIVGVKEKMLAMKRVEQCPKRAGGTELAVVRSASL